MIDIAASIKGVARKDDDGKARFDLIPAVPLQSLADVYTFGARKYADRNWEKGIKWGRVFAAICRHLWSYWRGEDVDTESGMTHLAHAAWGCFTLMEFERTHKELDDRPGKTHPIKQSGSQLEMFDKNWKSTEEFGLPGKLWLGPSPALPVQQAEVHHWPQQVGTALPPDFSGLRI